MTKAKDHPLYPTWQNMRDRQPPDFVRGNMVCERWRHDFWQFVQDVGERPPGMRLTRLDKHKPFSPENCRWYAPPVKKGDWVRSEGDWVWKKKERRYKWQKGSPRPPSAL
jgi:hypothetical protein